jgi:hypothetical protein
MPTFLTAASALRVRLVGLYAALVTAYAALVTTAVTARPVGFLVALLVASVVDAAVERTPELWPITTRSQVAVSHRSLIRDLSFVALALRTDWPSDEARTAVICLTALLPLLRTAYLTVQVPLRRRLDAPVEVRNVDLSGLPLARRPHRLLLEHTARRLHFLGLPVLVAGAVAAALGAPALFYAVAGLTLVLTVAVLGMLVAALLQFRRCLHGDGLLDAVMRRVDETRPEVVLHHSGKRDTLYQVDMWLSTMDRLRRPGVVVLRERALLPLLGACATPVVCIPSSVDFMNAPLPAVRVALYTANVGKNIHLLRVPGVCHAFIGHGDSDKTASFNPFSRVYSQIWVAGPAGRDRYLTARVGVRQEDIVEVGRPQLDEIDVSGAAGGPVFTVLYAPTWEGWINDATATSLITTGPRLIERLLEVRPHVRIVYKPHPLTGSVSPRARRAHEQVVALLAADNARRAKDPDLAALPGGAPTAVDDDLDAPPPAGGALDPEAAERYQRWSDAWWQAAPSWAHRVVDTVTPRLYDCFNRADLLVADISSVVTDFVASGKPYVVTNLTGLSDEDFRTRFPSVAAAYALDPAAEQLPDVIAQVRGPDPLRSARRAQKRYLLGPDEPDAMTRFNDAVDSAVAAAVELWPDPPASARRSA